MDRHDRRASAFLALAAALYYAFCLPRLPFNFADEGYLYYVADALGRGATPYRDVRLFGYLPGLFYLFAPLVRWRADEVLLARGLMLAGLVVKTIVFYGCARRFAGRGAATAAAVVVLLVPGPWHKFYVGLLSLWVLHALIGVLERSGDSARAAAHAGLAVGTAAVLRMDVAVTGAVLLVAATAFPAWRSGRLDWPKLLVGPATAVGVTLPLQGLLLYQGVLTDWFRQWLGFAGLLARRSLPEARLPSPPPEALLHLDGGGADAWIHYGALAIVLAHLLLVARRPSAVGWLTGFWAVAGVPQFAFERPDAAHLTQYSHAFLLPAAILADRVLGVLPRRRSRWAAGAAACLAAALFAGRHTTAGPWRRPAQSVVLANGFAYPAQAGESLRPILETIVRESAPHEQIAALPFLPGVAFATRRRLHGRDVYLAPHAMTGPEFEADYVRSLAASPPRFVVYQPAMSFNGKPSGRLEGFAPAVDAHLRAHFGVVAQNGGLLLMEPLPASRNAHRSGP